MIVSEILIHTIYTDIRIAFLIFRVPFWTHCTHYYCYNVIKYKTSWARQWTSMKQYIFSIDYFTSSKGYCIFVDLWYILINLCMFWCIFWMTISNSPTLHPHHLHQWHLWQEDQGAVWVLIWEVRLLDIHIDIWEKGNVFKG